MPPCDLVNMSKHHFRTKKRSSSGHPHQHLPKVNSIKNMWHPTVQLIQKLKACKPPNQHQSYWQNICCEGLSKKGGYKTSQQWNKRINWRWKSHSPTGNHHRPPSFFEKANFLHLESLSHGWSLRPTDIGYVNCGTKAQNDVSKKYSRCTWKKHEIANKHCFQVNPQK